MYLWLQNTGGTFSDVYIWKTHWLYIFASNRPETPLLQILFCVSNEQTYPKWPPLVIQDSFFIESY